MDISLQPPFKQDGFRETESHNGVYTSLADLSKLEFKTQGFSFLPKQPINSLLSGRHASLLRGRGLNFEEIRRYLPGDDVRTIDWHVTARTLQPHVRVYTEERDRSCFLIVDQRTSMFFGSKRVMKSVAAAEAAALAAWKVFHSGDRVGAIVFNDSEIIELSPQRSRSRVVEILNTIVKMNRKLKPDGNIKPNGSMIDRVIARVRGMVPHDWLVAMISDGFGADDGISRPVTEIAEHNDLISLFIYDPLEEQLPQVGNALFGSGHERLEVDTASRFVHKAFADDFARRLVFFKELARERNMPLIPLSTAFEIGEQLRELIGRRIL